jgi:hypothetical protein
LATPQSRLVRRKLRLKKRGALPESLSVVVARKHLAGEDLPARLRRREHIARMPRRFPFVKNAEDARPATRHQRASRARAEQSISRTLDFGTETKNDRLEVVAQVVTERI